MGEKRLTEGEWLAEEKDDPYRMLYFLHRLRKGRPSARKARLLACACVRRDLGALKEPWQRQAVEVAERFADGQASKEEVRRAQDAACGRPDCSYWAARTDSHCMAAEAVLRSGHQCDEAERAACGLLRCVVGNPFRPLPRIEADWLAWDEGVVVKLARAAYEKRRARGRLDGARLRVLADALEEAGCADAEVLGHLRAAGPHVRGCWPVDLCLGRK